MFLTPSEDLWMDFSAESFPDDAQLTSALVPIQAGSTYTLRIPLDRYRIVDWSEEFDRFLSARVPSVQAEIFEESCAAEQRPKLMAKTCRQGVAKSSVQSR